MKGLGRIQRVLARVNGAILRVCGVAAWLFLAGMTSVILLQVFCRYVLNAPLSWPEEAARYMMVWMTFLVAPVAYRGEYNVRLEMLTGNLAGAAKTGLELILHGLIVATTVFFFMEALWMVDRGGLMDSSALGIKMRYVFAILPVSFGLLCAVGIEKIFGLLGKPDGESPERDPHLPPQASEPMSR